MVSSLTTLGRCVSVFSFSGKSKKSCPFFRLIVTCVQDYDFPLPFTASPEKTAKGRRWARLLSEILVKINLRPNPVLIMPRGLAGVAHGYQYMREGKVRMRSHTLNVSFFNKKTDA
jgi:hypothetical protein